MANHHCSSSSVVKLSHWNVSGSWFKYVFCEDPWLIVFAFFGLYTVSECDSADWSAHRILISRHLPYGSDLNVMAYISINLCLKNELNLSWPSTDIDCISLGSLSSESMSLIRLFPSPMPRLCQRYRLDFYRRTLPVSNQVVVITRWTQAICGLSSGYKRASTSP